MICQVVIILCKNYIVMATILSYYTRCSLCISRMTNVLFIQLFEFWIKSLQAMIRYAREGLAIKNSCNRLKDYPVV